MKLSFFIASLFLTTGLMAQQSSVPGKMSFYAELGGPGILFSANIDGRFSKSVLGIGGRIGIGFVTTDTYDNNTGFYESKSVGTFPIQLNYIFGKPNSVHTFEVGAGATFTTQKIDPFDSYDNQSGSSVFGTASFMYRRQPQDGGFSWRIGFTPIIGGGFIQPSGGVSFGYNF